MRSLLKKMGIEIIESEFSRENSQCCGDNYTDLDQYHDLLDEYIKWRSEEDLDMANKPREE